MDALLLIDLQADYFADDELARCRADVVAACTRLATAAHERGVPVFEVRTVHEEDRSTWTLSMLEDDQSPATAPSCTPTSTPASGAWAYGGWCCAGCRPSPAWR